MRMIYGGFNPTRESMFVSEIKNSAGIDFRDKTVGTAYNQNTRYEKFKPTSVWAEIKENVKIGLLDVNVSVKHKIFGYGKIVRKVSASLFEVVFDDTLDKKTIKGDFLEFCNTNL